MAEDQQPAASRSGESRSAMSTADKVKIGLQVANFLVVGVIGTCIGTSFMWAHVSVLQPS